MVTINSSGSIARMQYFRSQQVASQWLKVFYFPGETRSVKSAAPLYLMVTGAVDGDCLGQLILDHALVLRSVRSK